jgi:WD40 repeat protein
LLWQVDTTFPPFDNFKNQGKNVSKYPSNVSAGADEARKKREAVPDRQARQAEVINAGKLLQRFTAGSLGRAHENLVGDLAFSLDGKWLVSVGMSTGRPSFVPLGTKGEFSYAGPVELRSKNFVRIWEVETGRLVQTFDNSRTDSTISVLRDGQDKGSSALTVAVSPDNTTIAVGFTDGTIRFWPMPKSDQLATTETGTVPVAVVPED